MKTNNSLNLTLDNYEDRSIIRIAINTGFVIWSIMYQVEKNPKRGDCTISYVGILIVATIIIYVNFFKEIEVHKTLLRKLKLKKNKVKKFMFQLPKIVRKRPIYKKYFQLNLILK